MIRRRHDKIMCRAKWVSHKKIDIAKPAELVKNIIANELK